jgi:mRNA interferase MazF
MKRGEFVTIALPGDFGKPRPALVIQSDLFDETSTVTLLLLTTSIVDLPTLRVIVDPDASNGLSVRSQIQIDKVFTAMRAKVGVTFGRIRADLLAEVERRLALFMGIAK